jgi:hypothetical protein
MTKLTQHISGAVLAILAILVVTEAVRSEYNDHVLMSRISSCGRGGI